MLACVSATLSSAFLQCNWVCRADPSPFLLSLISVSVLGVFDIFDREKNTFKYFGIGLEFGGGFFVVF